MQPQLHFRHATMDPSSLHLLATPNVADSRTWSTPQPDELTSRTHPRLTYTGCEVSSFHRHPLRIFSLALGPVLANGHHASSRRLDQLQSGLVEGQWPLYRCASRHAFWTLLVFGTSPRGHDSWIASPRLRREPCAFINAIW